MLRRQRRGALLTYRLLRLNHFGSKSVLVDLPFCRMAILSPINFPCSYMFGALMTCSPAIRTRDTVSTILACIDIPFRSAK